VRAILAVVGDLMAQNRKILIVDDDDDVRSSLSEQLSLHKEFATVEATTGAAALTQIKAERPDLVILDVGLPDTDGRDVAKAARVEGFDGPIVFLTGHTSDEDAIAGLGAGANDYVTKPFRFAVLLARIRAHLRQREASDDVTLTIGDYVFHPRSKQLVAPKGGKLRLTEKETAILRYLYRAAPAVVRRDVLLREVWGYNSNVTTHTLETHIYRLRQKIEPNAEKTTLLVTEDGGYRLIV
jgi:DNA-binding response OmpR family regulator